MTYTFQTHARRPLVASVLSVVLVLATLVAAPAATASEAATSAAAEPSAAASAGLPSSADALMALSGSNFNPGFIISDQLFYNGNAMSQAQIQAFLDGKCPTNNCLNVVSAESNTRAVTNMCPNGYTGAASESAAAIIYKVQVACGISAKAILVILQKEQSLVTTQNPSANKLRIAMGYACPDTSACDSKFFGLFNQLYSAASQLKRYGLRTSDNVSFRTKYQIGVPYPIGYHPNADCGTKSVTVQNMATTALYYYTPYTPNDAALANLGGTGNSCSSYGNRNFWVFYNSWFGSSTFEDGSFAINAAYATAGGPTGTLGAQVGDFICPLGSVRCTQQYANGYIGWTINSGVTVITGAFATAYRLAGAEVGPLGTVASQLTGIVGPQGDGQSLAFATGTILSSTAGTFASWGTVRAKHIELGWVRGSLGWPIAAQACETAGCSQAFQGGTVFAPKTGAAVVVNAAIGAAFAAAGGSSGPLGFPSSGLASVTGPKGDGQSQAFATGTILVSAAGTFATWGGVRAKHIELGWVRGSLGWPTAVQTCDSAGCSQAYQGGTIIAPVSGAAYVVVGGSGSDPFATLHQQLGGDSGPLGAVVGQVVAITGPKGDGQSQAYATGTIVSSAAGIFASWGAVRAKHIQLGWVRGSLGWPTAAQACDSAGCSQAFQGGTIFAPLSGAAYVVVGGGGSGSFDTVYQQLGGATGPLGAVAGQVTNVTGPMGDGQAQAFATGTILSSTAGIFGSWGAVRAKHIELGWVRGSLGWPTAAQVCDTVGCSQAFQGGTVYAPKSGAAAVLGPVVSAAYAASGGTTGPLGFPVGALASITGPKGNGQSQAFATGTIVSSSAGVFASWGAVRAKHIEQGWVRGALGWPTAAQVCDTVGCSQAFQGGTVVAPLGAPAYVTP